MVRCFVCFLFSFFCEMAALLLLSCSGSLLPSASLSAFALILFTAFLLCIRGCGGDIIMILVTAKNNQKWTFFLFKFVAPVTVSVCFWFFMTNKSADWHSSSNHYFVKTNGCERTQINKDFCS